MVGDSPLTLYGGRTHTEVVGEREDLLEMLEEAKKRKLLDTMANNYESTSADSSLSNFSEEEEEEK